MTILLVAKPWKGGLAKYLHMALKAMFPEEVRFLPTYPDTPAQRRAYRRNRQAWRESLVPVIEQAEAEAVIVVNPLEAFRRMAHSPRHVLWITDAPRLEPADTAPYGRIFLSDGGYEEEIQAVSKPGVYAGELPFAHHPPLHCPAPAASRPKTVCFVGNADPARDALLARLFAAGLHPTVVGNYFFRHPLWWRHPLAVRPAVPNEAMAGIYARHRVSLNIHAQVIRTGTNMRTFECAGYQIAQVVDAKAGAETAFAREREILTYTDPEDMVRQIRRLLQDPDRARAMARRARQRALDRHTYYHRIQTMLDGVVNENRLRQGARRVGIE